MSLEVWKAEHGPILSRKPAIVPTDPSSKTSPLLAVEYADVKDAPPPPVPTSTSPVPLSIDLASPSAANDEGSIAASPSAPASGIVGGRRDEMQLCGHVQKPLMVEEKSAKLVEARSAEEPTSE
ncbi:unnamed protein product [Closterium sp. NIES-54]